MYKLIAVIFTVLCLTVSLSAQTHKALDDITSLRKEGSERNYQFLSDTLVIGELKSTYVGKSRFEGDDVIRLDGDLSLDYGQLGQAYKIKIFNKRYLNESNRYLGDDMSIIANDQADKLFVKNGKEYLDGYSIRNNVEDDILIPLGQNHCAIDNNMLDQYELYLATKDFKVGDTILDTIFVPQNIYLSSAEIVIEEFKWTYYDQYADSAFVCHFTRPTDITIYLTRQNKVIRADMPYQNLKAVLIENPLDKIKDMQAQKTVNAAVYFSRLPVYVYFLIITGLCALPFIKKSYRKIETYISIALGMIGFVLVYFIQMPFLEWYSLNFIIPGSRAGESFYSLAIMPTIFRAVLPELLKIGIIFLLIKWKKPNQIGAISLGLFAALGYAFFEACQMTGEAYQKGAFEFLSLTSVQRIGVAIFHAASGAAYGYAFNRGKKYLLIMSSIMIGAQFIAWYMITFVQTRAIDLALLQIITIIIFLIVLLTVYIIIKSGRASIPGKK